MIQFAEPTWPINPPRRWQTECFGVVRRHFMASGGAPAVVSAIMGAGKSLLIQEICATVALSGQQTIVVSTSTEHLVEDLTHDIRIRCGRGRSVGIWYGKRKRLGQVVVCCVDSMQGLAQILKTNGHAVHLWIADEAHKTECDTVLAAASVMAPEHALGLTATAFRADKFEAISLFKDLIYRYGVKECQADGNVVVPWRIVNFDGLTDGDDLDKACLEMIRNATGPGLANAVDIADAEGFASFLSDHGIPSKAVHSRLNSHDRRMVLEDLKNGKLRCCVHVNLLTEGSNYPWLCWLLLRREVESRVRFCQEIGRALRAHNEPIWERIHKTEAVFYDPHDLFGSFSLSYAEALGEPPERPEWDREIPPPPEEIAERIHEADPPVAMGWVESAVRTLVVACDSARLMPERKPIKKAERLKPSTPMQQAALNSAVDGVRALSPAGWLKCLEEIAYRPDVVRFGFASDLLLALTGIRQHQSWPPVNAQGQISVAIGDVDEPARPVSIARAKPLDLFETVG